MLTKLKVDEFSKEANEPVQFDSHVRDYQAQEMGIKVVLCDESGVAVSETFAPMASYFPSYSHNM